jgi:hypothetical protein
LPALTAHSTDPEYWLWHIFFVLHDRDASFTAAFDAVFQAANAIMERWIGGCRRELLDPGTSAT